MGGGVRRPLLGWGGFLFAGVCTRRRPLDASGCQGGGAAPVRGAEILVLGRLVQFSPALILRRRRRLKKEKNIIRIPL